MGKVIGRLPVVYDPATRRLTVESAGEFVETQLFQRLDELAKDKPLRLTLTGTGLAEIENPSQMLLEGQIGRASCRERV